jgi:hypothetical protein
MRKQRGESFFEPALCDFAASPGHRNQWRKNSLQHDSCSQLVGCGALHESQQDAVSFVIDMTAAEAGEGEHVIERRDGVGADEPLLCGRQVPA